MSKRGRCPEPSLTGPDSWLLAAVGVHLLASTAHGVAHGVVPVPVPDWLLGVATGTLFVGPLAGCWLLVRGRRWSGGWLVLVSALTGAIVETVAHFVVTNPDHVSQTTHAAFTPTALGSTLGTALAALVATWYVACYRHGGVVSSATEPST